MDGFGCGLEDTGLVVFIRFDDEENKKVAGNIWLLQLQVVKRLLAE